MQYIGLKEETAQTSWQSVRFVPRRFSQLDFLSSKSLMISDLSISDLNFLLIEEELPRFSPPISRSRLLSFTPSS